MHKKFCIILLSCITTVATAMQQNQLNDLILAKDLEQSYINTHGWTVDTNSGTENVVVQYDNGYKLQPKIAIARNLERYNNSHFFIKQKYHSNSYITSQGYKGKLRIIDMPSGNKETTLSEENDSVHCCTNTDYENIIASGSEDQTVKVWNTNTRRCLQTLSGHNKQIIQVASEQNMLASIDDSPCVKLWDISSGKCKHTELLTKEGKPCSIMIHETLIYISFMNGTIMVIDPRCESFGWKAHQKPVTCLTACKHLNHTLYSGSSDQTIKQWDFRYNSAPIITLQQNKNNHNIQNIYEDYTGQKLFSSDMNTVYVWNISEPKPKLVTTKKIHRNIARNSMPMNDDETELYIATTDGIKTLTPSLDLKTLKKLLEKKSS